MDGILYPRMIGVRADGSAVLIEFRTSDRHIGNTRDQMVPELRNVFEADKKALGKEMLFRMITCLPFIEIVMNSRGTRCRSY